MAVSLSLVLFDVLGGIVIARSILELLNACKLAVVVELKVWGRAILEVLIPAKMVVAIADPLAGEFGEFFVESLVDFGPRSS